MNVNSYLVESAESLVLVDGMLTVSDARAVRARLESSSKPLRGLLVTHAHPDHYAGAAEILAGREQVPIYSTRAVRDMIARDDALKDQIVGPMMGDQWPTRRRFPDAIVDGTLELGDLRFSVKDLGCGESPADSIWSLDERTLFVGDLVYNGMHAYLTDSSRSGLPCWTASKARAMTRPGSTSVTARSQAEMPSCDRENTLARSSIPSPRTSPCLAKSGARPSLPT